MSRVKNKKNIYACCDRTCNKLLDIRYDNYNVCVDCLKVMCSGDRHYHNIGKYQTVICINCIPKRYRIIKVENDKYDKDIMNLEKLIEQRTDLKIK